MNGDSSNLYMDWGTETMALPPFFFRTADGQSVLQTVSGIYLGVSENIYKLLEYHPKWQF